MNTNTPLQELRQLIDQADEAYYTRGTAIMEDARYDALIAELQALDPTDPRLKKVGAAVRDGMLQKREHIIPMGSQFKATNREEFLAWVSTAAGEHLHASYKMDGGSLSLEYRDGRMVAAVSRGDGKVGEDITANAMKFRNLPMVCRLPDGRSFTGFVRGEIILSVEDWEQVDGEKLSNPRNCAVGMARRKNGHQGDALQVYAFRVFDADGSPVGRTEAEQDAIMTKMGFTCAPALEGTPEQVWHWYEQVGGQRAALPYWIDGVVVKVDDLERQLQMGETDNRPKGQVALKFEAEGAKTTLRQVSLQVGYTGAIIPVAEFDPVQIGGTKVAFATLCNWENIRTLGLAIGDEIEVVKAGDIIPRIMRVTAPGVDQQRAPIPEPSECPTCGGTVGHRNNVSGDESTILYCLNGECPSKLTGRIERYLKSLDIQGIGEHLILALVSAGVGDPADLYQLAGKREMLTTIQLRGKVRLGEKRADKFLAEIEKKRQLPLSDFLGSLGVFGLGKRRVALIQQAVPGEFDSIEDWLSGKLITLADKAGIPNTAQRLQADINDLRPLIEKFLSNGLVITVPRAKTQARADALTFCITGSLSQPKAVYADMIEKAGHIYTDTFSKAVTHLVTANPASESAKLQKAVKQGTRVISEQDLISLVQLPA